MRRLIVCSLWTIVAGCGGASPTTPTPPPGPVTFAGTVRDFQTQVPRAGVTVRLITEGTGVTATTVVTGLDGRYVATVDATGGYAAFVGELVAGTLRVTGPAYRGDLLTDSSGCTSRYGVVSDTRTLLPVAGASVTLRDQTRLTGEDGSYRIDLGCAPDFNFSTTFIAVTHPRYQQRQQVVGRGVQGVLRLDVDLTPN